MVHETITTERQIVLFGLDGELYGIDISDVQEIIRMESIKKVPKAPFFIEGIINLRGHVVPVINIRKRLDIGAVEQTIETRIVVVNIEGTIIGIIVDRVEEVIRIREDSIELPSKVVATGDSDYIKGIARKGEQMVILLNLRGLLPEGDLENIDNLAETTM